MARLHLLALGLAALLLPSCAHGRSADPLITEGFVGDSYVEDDDHDTKIVEGWHTHLGGECPISVERLQALINEFYAEAGKFGYAPENIGVPEFFRGEVNPTYAGRPIDGRYDPQANLLIYRCGVEKVIVHEMGHYLCEHLALDCPCHLVDHKDGYDLGCNSLVAR